MADISENIPQIRHLKRIDAQHAAAEEFAAQVRASAEGDIKTWPTFTCGPQEKHRPPSCRSLSERARLTSDPAKHLCHLCLSNKAVVSPPPRSVSFRRPSYFSFLFDRKKRESERGERGEKDALLLFNLPVETGELSVGQPAGWFGFSFGGGRRRGYSS